jgi:hypothetical protein
MICYNHASTSDVILEQLCMYCNSGQELTTISASDICYSCIEFLDTIVCTKCKTQKQKIASPCINCQRVIYSERILMKKDSLPLENPDEMKTKKCKKCRFGINIANLTFRTIEHFCKRCYRNRDNRYFCDPCFDSYKNNYKVCFTCTNIIRIQ